MASIVSINISKEKGTVKQPVCKAKLVHGFGIEGDAHGENWHRQVSLLSQSSIDTMKQRAGMDLPPGTFAENITVEGLDVFTLPIGTQIRLGECVVEVTQIGKQCHQHCEIFKKVGSCVMPTEGIFCIVLREGVIFPGDSVKILEGAPQ